MPMLSFACGHCGRLVFSDNTVCLHCSTPLGFVADELDLVALEGERAASLARVGSGLVRDDKLHEQSVVPVGAVGVALVG
jgi:hypothetical protein